MACYVLSLVIFSLLCSVAVHSDNLSNSSLTNAEKFFKIGTSLLPISDKFETHQYSEIYGFLLSFVRRLHKMNKSIKFLEIGMGCNMIYGPGASVQLWKNIFFHSDQIWEAEVNGTCVEESKSKGLLENIHVLVGDQANKTVLKTWIQQSGGMFDIIVDDGGHIQHQIYNSFELLWPELTPGGLYFIEDLHVSREFYDYKVGILLMIDVIHSWTEELVIGKGKRIPHLSTDKSIVPDAPKGMKWILCQHEMCLIAKCDDSFASSTKCDSAHVDMNSIPPDTHLTHAEFFHKIGMNGHPVSNKFTSHQYSEIYGSFLLPFVHRQHRLNKTINFLEIGAGCDASSVQLWKQIFKLKTDVIWKADLSVSCMEELKKKKKHADVRALIGNQSDKGIVDSWIRGIGEKVHVVVDEGRHSQQVIYDSFQLLWPILVPGGLYFLEDLDSSRSINIGELSMIDVIHSWTEELVIGYDKHVPRRNFTADSRMLIPKAPQGIKWIVCQHEMCLIAKCDQSFASNSKCVR